MKVKIQKFNPLFDAEPYYVEGDIPWREMITALDAVYDFHTTIEPISFDYSCGGRSCGKCAVMLNGEPKLLCITKLDEGKEYTIEPLKGFSIIRDLVVDKSAYDESITLLSNRFLPEAITTKTAVIQNFDYADYSERTKKALHHGEYCCRCGMCSVTCPALEANPEEFVGPAHMLAIGFRHLDWYEQTDRVAQAVGAGLYHCSMCGTCSSVCGCQIDHLNMWSILREAAVERDLVPSYAKRKS